MKKAEFSTPWGVFVVTTDERGALTACRPVDGAAAGGITAAFPQMEEYLRGARRQFDVLLAMRGTPFQRAVWELLLRIPYGTTTTYRHIADQLGSAPRAVGGAVGANPLAIFIPCHRVVGSNGSLTGYAWGVAMKAGLLALESRPRVGR